MRKQSKPRQGLVQVKDLVEGALKQLGAKGDFDRYRLESQCRQWLGKAVQGLVRMELRKGTVLLAFNHPIWLNEMNFKKAEGLRFLQSQFPELGLKKIEVILAK